MHQKVSLYVRERGTRKIIPASPKNKYELGTIYLIRYCRDGKRAWEADVQPSSFEQIVRRLRLSPDQYLGSVQLKEWVRKNKDQKYVPSDLLKAWDFEAATDL